MIYIIVYIAMTLLSIALVGVYYRFFNKPQMGVGFGMPYYVASVFFFMSWIPIINAVSILVVMAGFVVRFYSFVKKLVLGE